MKSVNCSPPAGMRHMSASRFRNSNTRCRPPITPTPTGASDELVVAALVHDIGHLIHKLPEDAADHGIDTRHEQLGRAWLAKHCSPAVTEPVRLHVAAKRYRRDRSRLSRPTLAGERAKPGAARRPDGRRPAR